MRISIAYPPLESGKGTPLLSQNRQFQWFSEPTYIYPMVPAYAATLLDKAGYEVIWDDGISEEKTYDQWVRGVESLKPDLVMLETKTPVVKRHWRCIDDIKNVIPDSKVVLVGDHVTALPQESMEKSRVDYILTGGDYDFLLLNLAEHLEHGVELEPGIWYRKNGKIRSTGRFHLNHDLNTLPFVDRDLTKWWLYSEKNGNYKETPGTYLMAGRDCWWRTAGGCTFCSWPILYPTFRTRQPELIVEEVGMLVEKYGVREIMDDTGTFPVGSWLKKFCGLMIKEGYNKEVVLDCNMRFGALGLEDYRLMREAGFRMLLFGVESANQETLDRLNKGVSVERMVEECRIASKAGLEPHITIMIGYPWENQSDAEKTIRLAKKLMTEGGAMTLQSTIVMAYPGTKLHQEALRKGWFRIDPNDYERYDMTEPVFNTSDMSPEEVMEVCKQIYGIFLSPSYVFQHLTRIRSWRDLKYSTRGVAKILGHLKDFGGR